MRIQELSLHTRHLAEQKDFYHTALGLPLLAETTASFTLKAGATRLRFEEAQQDVLYHVAFTIPRNTFTETKSWLRKYVSLLRKHSEDEFFFATLNARSFYFCDAANNILELIVYYDLNHETEGPFGPAQVLHVSEIGLPVEDVLAQVSLLKEKLTIEPYRGLVSEAVCKKVSFGLESHFSLLDLNANERFAHSLSEEFAFMGDMYGQLVVVKIGRPWEPAETLMAAVSPVQFTMSGKPEQQFQLSPYPYTITVVR
jgi:catechol-2,3-dioxygenase